MHGNTQISACVLTSILFSVLHFAGSGSALAQVDNPFRDVRALDYGPDNTAQALEVRMQAMPGNPRRLVVVSLYNQAPGTNAIAAHILEPPFDSGAVTLIDEIVVGTVFGLSDGCIFDDGVDQRLVFPFVQLSVGGDGILRTATFDGEQWDVVSQSGPPGNIFDSGDCVRIGDKLFLSGHDTQQNRVVVLDSRLVSGINVQFGFAFCVGGVDSCLLGDSADTADDILGISQEVPRHELIALGGEEVNALGLFSATANGMQFVSVDAPALPFPEESDVVVTPLPLPEPNRSKSGRGFDIADLAEMDCVDVENNPGNFLALCALNFGGLVPEQQNRGFYLLQEFFSSPNLRAPFSADRGAGISVNLIELDGPFNESGPLGFTAPAVLPDLPLGVHGLWGEVRSVDANNQLTDWYSYPAGWAQEGPAATCCEDPAGGVDGFIARSRPDGGVDFARFLLELIRRDGFE